VRRHAAVAAQQTPVGVWSDHRDGLQPREIQWENIPVVPEQRNRLARCLQCEVAIAVRPDHALRSIQVDVRIIEQSETELPVQDPA
jgi:hypothetical protein